MRPINDIPDDKLDQLLTALHALAHNSIHARAYGLPLADDQWMAEARAEVRDWLGEVLANAVDHTAPRRPGEPLWRAWSHDLSTIIAVASTPEGARRVARERGEGDPVVEPVGWRGRIA
jgi:hypothetical protein